MYTLDKRVVSALKKNRIIITSHEFDNSTFGYTSGYVASNAFNNKSEDERQKIIWTVLKKEIPQHELINISGILPLTPKEFKVLHNDITIKKHASKRKVVAKQAKRNPSTIGHLTKRTTLGGSRRTISKNVKASI